ncbi:unnamed protein product [Pleuronectes platessa]|uniref:Uncharacterized protein n=1 Tax=Pleuronectes platessa TaxID=8262 RepID=A0A9N7U670_PLEPL|nr:unnamed protein product [Pleuronectes platessa]
MAWTLPTKRDQHRVPEAHGCSPGGKTTHRQHLDRMVEAGVEQVGQHSSDEVEFFALMKSRRSGSHQVVGSN